MLRIVLSILPIALVTSLSMSAHAQSADAATAELLFQQGRDLLRDGKLAEACPKLAESQKLDPATGTLLALAMCHQREGKRASAWAEFKTVQTQARGEGRPDREDAARQQAEALKGTLSTLELRVPAAVAGLPGLKVLRDGVALGDGAWGIAAPVDGGEHVIEVTANGKLPWRHQLMLGNESDRQVVIISVPEDVPARVDVRASKGDQRNGVDERTSIPTKKPWGSLEWSGVAAAGAGVVALGAGGYFLAVALGKNSDSNKDCNGKICGDQGYADRASAISKGNTATIVGIAGGVLVAGGATLFVVGRTRGDERDTAAALAPRLALGAGPQGVGATLLGRF